MATSAQLLGITPYILRLASYYACLGLGVYVPQGYAQFDKVVVDVAMPWKPDEQNALNSMLVLRVAFYKGDHRYKFIEFGLRPEGFGGDPIVREV